MKNKSHRIAHGINKGFGVIVGPITSLVIYPFLGMTAGAQHWHEKYWPSKDSHNYFAKAVSLSLLPYNLVGCAMIGGIFAIPEGVKCGYRVGATHFLSAWLHDEAQPEKAKSKSHSSSPRFFKQAHHQQSKAGDFDGIRPALF